MPLPHVLHMVGKNTSCFQCQLCTFSCKTFTSGYLSIHISLLWCRTALVYRRVLRRLEPKSLTVTSYYQFCPLNPHKIFLPSLLMKIPTVLKDRHNVSSCASSSKFTQASCTRELEPVFKHPIREDFTIWKGCLWGCVGIHL